MGDSLWILEIKREVKVCCKEIMEMSVEGYFLLVPIYLRQILIGCNARKTRSIFFLFLVLVFTICTGIREIVEIIRFFGVICKKFFVYYLSIIYINIFQKEESYMILSILRIFSKIYLSLCCFDQNFISYFRVLWI